MKYVLEIWCSWCQKKIGEKPSNSPGRTDTACPKCYQEQLAAIKLLKN